MRFNKEVIGKPAIVGLDSISPTRSPIHSTYKIQGSSYLKYKKDREMSKFWLTFN